LCVALCCAVPRWLRGLRLWQVLELAASLGLDQLGRLQQLP
jgi:hypothetical protein